jgi:DNA-binding GntR family transcriptional regulator
MSAKRTDDVAVGEADNSLSDQICELIRQRIFEQKLVPGDRLIERVLAEEFRVSRVPVRAALGQLVSEGIVTTLPRRGAFVTVLSEADLEHLFEIREALEVLAFRIAAKRASEQDVARLAQIVEAAKKATEADDHSAIASLNTEFHEAVVDITGNPYLKSTLDPLVGRLRLMRAQSHAHGWQLAEHTGLFEAIAEHDVERAGALATRHVQVSRDRTLNDAHAMC